VTASAGPAAASVLRLRRLGVDTYRQAVVYMHRDCPVCRSEGFEALARVRVAHSAHDIVATLNVVTGDLLGPDEAALSDAAWELLGARDGDAVEVTHAPPLTSMRHVRGKIHGRRLDGAAFREVIGDVAAGRYGDVHLAAFVAAGAAGGLDHEEMVHLTNAMVEVGERINWGRSPILDKHSVGGLPGNRTTPIVVPIAAACGLTVPKTSSRAITSPAGTADAMETLAPVELDLPAIRRVVEREGACLVWGGAVRLSPADDVLIRIERPLDLDAEGQLVASVLSKKIAAGSTHVVIDMPVGPTAKVRSGAAARRLAGHLAAVGRSLGLEVDVVRTDGTQPVGRGIGPALEARDVLAVLRGDASAPADLRDRAVLLAGRLLEVGGAAAAGEGRSTAAETLADGRAWRKFVAICEAQGGLREPPRARHVSPVEAGAAGTVAAVDNRRLARAAKLAGAPRSPAAGLLMHARIGDRVARGQPLFSLHADAPGELSYALEYLGRNPDVVKVEEAS
jgi:thymidine phosphorylase